jgi:DNA invertase Pin-like site-specific DNA recombinase
MRRGLISNQQTIDTTTPMGKLVFQLTGAFAEFERTMIRQRIKACLKRAVSQGVKLGQRISGERAMSPRGAQQTSGPQLTNSLLRRA